MGALVLFSACSDSSTPPPQQAPVTPVDQATAGTIQVQVRFTGKVPPSKELSLRSVPACAAAHPGPVYDEAISVRDGRLANVVVWIKDGLGDRRFAIPTAPVTIDQKGCLYAPPVAAVMVGQPLQFVNSDPEPHNVHGSPQIARGWNFIMSRQGSSRTVYFDKSEVGIPIRCDVHPWMLAHLSVFPHPYFAVTPSDGSVTLNNVPPGNYVLATWHRELGTKEQPVTLEPKASSRVEFTYSAP